MSDGGRKDQGSGYAFVLMPHHPRASETGYVLEHVLVVERALGKYVAAEHPIHHHDENRRNNKGGNLVLCEDAAYHKLLHRRQRALAACGNPSALRCNLCKGYDRQENITASTQQTRQGRNYDATYHRSCAAERRRQQRQPKVSGTP